VKAILLTGGSGVLGRVLRERLRHTTLFCLVRRTPIADQNIIPLMGDVSRVRLGLTRSEYVELAGRIDLIIHAAAVTDFDRAPELYSGTNVDGTKNVVELADAANVPLYYIGTAFSDGPGYFSSFGADSYQQSKRAAEAFVRSCGLPSVILRPSIIVGDSNTGAIGRFQGFHSIIDLACRGMLPFALASPDSYMDLVPQDLVARIIVALIERGDRSGDYWLTLGDRALTVAQLLNICVEHASRLTGRQIPRPRAFAPDVFERLIKPVFLPALPPDVRDVLNRALRYAKYCNIDTPFPTSLPALASELDIGELPSPELTLVRNLEYWVSCSNLARPIAMN
jgi:nucleoside-diphosphate-sugar epimerase